MKEQLKTNKKNLFSFIRDNDLARKICVLIISIFSVASLNYNYKDRVDCRGIEFGIVFIVTLLLVNYTIVNWDKNSKRERTTFLILAAFYSIFWNIGRTAINYQDFRKNDHKILLLMMFMAGAFLFFICLINIVYKFFVEYFLKADTEKRTRASIFVGIILISAVYYIIVYYPGTSFTDGLRQMQSYDGYIEWENHDPAFSSLIIGSLLNLGQKLINDNFGLFLYNMLMYIYSTVVYILLIKLLNKLRMPTVFNMIVAMFYAFLPIIRYYSITVCKDTSYAVTILLLMIMMVRVRDRINNNEEVKLKEWIGIILVLLLSCNLRNDGIYVALFVLFVSFLCINIKKQRIIIAAGAFVLIAFHVFYGSVLLDLVGIKKGSIREALSVPAQQTAVLMTDHPDTYTEEEKAKLNDFFTGNLDRLPEVYKSNISDPVKALIVYYPTSQQKKDYFSLWFKGLLKHPGTYIKAYLASYYGYVYPDLHGDEGGFSGFFFAPRFAKTYDFHYSDATQWFRDKTVDFKEHLDNFPLFSLLYNPGFYTWVVMFCIAIMIIKKRGRAILAVAPIIGVILISCLSPVNCRIRYFLPVIFCFPLLIAYTGYEIKQSQEGKEGIKLKEDHHGKQRQDN